MKSKTIRVDQIAYLIPIKILCVLISSVTRWLDYLLILSHMQQWKFGQWHKCWPKQVHIFAQHKISPHIIAKDFKNIAKNGDILPNLVTLIISTKSQPPEECVSFVHQIFSLFKKSNFAFRKLGFEPLGSHPFAQSWM